MGWLLNTPALKDGLWGVTPWGTPLYASHRVALVQNMDSDKLLMMAEAHTPELLWPLTISFCPWAAGLEKEWRGY